MDAPRFLRHAPGVTWAFYALVIAWLVWMLRQSSAIKPNQPAPPADPPTPPADETASGKIELADDQTLRRFVPPSFESPLDLAEMYANPEVAYSGAVTEIRGLVDDASAYLGASGDALRDGWLDHSFDLAAWAAEGEPIQQRRLLIMRPVPHKRFRNDISPGKVVRMRVFLDEARTRAIVDALLSREERSGDFAPIAAQLREPILRETDAFGTLEYDRQGKNFEGKGRWREQPVEVSFQATSLEELEPLLPVATALWAAQERWQDEIDAGLVDALLETANDWASDMDEPAMTAEQFLSRLRLETVSFDERGEFTFWLNDGDVFAGHVVNASGSLGEGIRRCVFEG